MKICIFTNHFYPEDFKVNDLAFELQKLGYTVTVLTAIPDYPCGKFFEGYSLFKRRKEKMNGITVIRLPIIPRGNGRPIKLILNYLSYFICLSVFTFFHSRTEKYDCVFIHLTSPFFISLPAVYLKRKQHIPLIFWALDLWPESLISAGGISNTTVINSQTKIVSYVYKNCDKILIGSKGFGKSICEKGDFKNKLIYFPNWAEDINGETNNFLIKEIPPFNAVQPNNFILLFAGNIGEAQSLDAIIESAFLLKNNKHIKFVFIGDGRKKDHLQSLVLSYELSDTVFFPGRFPLSTMPTFMAHANVLIVALKDSLCFNLTVPAKVQFYMAQGKLILAMLNGDGADLVQEADCGIAVPAGDSKSFAEAVLKLSKTSTDKLHSLGLNGKIFYSKNFTKQQRIDQLDNLINQLVRETKLPLNIQNFNFQNIKKNHLTTGFRIKHFLKDSNR